MHVLSHLFIRNSSRCTNPYFLLLPGWPFCFRRGGLYSVKYRPIRASSTHKPSATFHLAIESSTLCNPTQRTFLSHAGSLGRLGSFAEAGKTRPSRFNDWLRSKRKRWIRWKDCPLASLSFPFVGPTAFWIWNACQFEYLRSRRADQWQCLQLYWETRRWILWLFWMHCRNEVFLISWRLREWRVYSAVLHIFIGF